MKVISDLQLHSKYSRAVSQQMEIPHIWEWAKRKGIGLVATGDWTHPLWMREIKGNLEEMGNGLLKLKDNSERLKVDGPYFLLATEVSSIYSQGGKLRRIHNLIWAPSISIAEKINKELTARGAKLISDGRPVVGLSSIQVADLVFSIDSNCLFIPAHAWTPWFSLYGSESGFDSIDDCFGSFSRYIYAIETGLSSDPAMNWRIKELDRRSILSFSDAHSGPKLGREATVLELEELSYENIRKAIIGSSSTIENRKLTIDAEDRKLQIENQSNNPPSSIFKNQSSMIHHPLSNHIAFTIEFYPEEGKYHYTGHRNCGIKQNPAETKSKGVICPVCGRKLTIGVMHRVEELAGRSEEDVQIKKTKIDGTQVEGISSQAFPERPPYIMFVPLQEILSEAIGGLPASQNVQREYQKLTDNLKGEFYVLLHAKGEDIAKLSGTRVAEAIHKVRIGDLTIDPGFDGVFGKVKIWNEESKDKEEAAKEQLSFF